MRLVRAGDGAQFECGDQEECAEKKVCAEKKLLLLSSLFNSPFLLWLRWLHDRNRNIWVAWEEHGRDFDWGVGKCGSKLQEPVRQDHSSKK